MNGFFRTAGDLLVLSIVLQDRLIYNEDMIQKMCLDNCSFTFQYYFGKVQVKGTAFAKTSEPKFTVILWGLKPATAWD